MMDDRLMMDGQLHADARLQGCEDAQTDSVAVVGVDAGCDAGTRSAPLEGNCFFQNRACEYFPCHEGVREDEFNCLFCYCPLYALGAECGGNFRYTKAGVKDCTGCTLLHRGDAGQRIVKERFQQLSELAKRGGPDAAADAFANDAGEGLADARSAPPRGDSVATANDIAFEGDVQ